jgi:hypothetical protein
LLRASGYADARNPTSVVHLRARCVLPRRYSCGGPVQCGAQAAANGNGHSTTQVEGVVSRVNERGVQLRVRDGWLNVSKFAQGVTLPDAGARVRLTLDAAGFIRGIDAIRSPDHPAVVSTGEAVDRETRITRSACLNIRGVGRPTWTA